MAELICNNCGYRFKSGRECKGLACPYCGKKEVKEEESIDDILKSIEE